MRPASRRGHVWLVGMPGAGKSTVGRLLAERLGRPFHDLDRRIEAQVGRSIPEIFAQEGEAAFRATEAALVRAAADEPDAVIATGGGAPCTAGLLDAMEASGLVVWLSAGIGEVLATLEVEERPLLASGDARARWLALEAARRSTYGRAPLIVPRGGRAPEAVADQIVRFLSAYGEAPLGLAPLPSRWVELGERRYPILFDTGADPAARFAAHLARRFPPARAPIGLVTDETVASLHAEAFVAALTARGFRVTVAVVPEGERAKSMLEAERVASIFTEGGLDRSSAVVALGGGVVGDLAGFVASILFRGIPCVQAPTTLLAMVDSSVGGKTGLNLRAGKNLVGTFHQPALVYAALATLSTLHARDLSAGLAELAKHALLVGGTLFARVDADAERAQAGDHELLAELVSASCAVKANVVESDEREEREDGGRMLLNLGHTVGHALESHSHHAPRPASERFGGPLRHGEAVALGLIAAARVGAAVGGAEAEPGLAERVTRLLDRLGLPTDLDARLRESGALDALAVDKKRASGIVRYVALLAPGRVRVVPFEPARLAALLLAPDAAPPLASSTIGG